MPLLPSRTKSVLCSLAWSLSNSTVLMSLDSGVPARLSWPASYLELLRWVRGFMHFWRKDESKRFPKSFSPLPQTRPPCPRWNVVEISILFVLDVSLQRNSPEDIYPRFHWLCWRYSPISSYTLSANRVWTRCPQCNPQDNVHPCTR